jgi:hypothetical protein
MASLNTRAASKPEGELRGALPGRQANAFECISKDSSVLSAPRPIGAAFWLVGVNGLADEAGAREGFWGAAVIEEFRQRL